MLRECNCGNNRQIILWSEPQKIVSTKLLRSVQTLSRQKTTSFIRPESQYSDLNVLPDSKSHTDNETESSPYKKVNLDDDKSSDFAFEDEDINDDKAWDTDLESDDVPQTYDHSGRNAYIESCHHFGVIPASYFLRHMGDRSLDMRHRGLGRAGIQAISSSLVSNASVLSLNLSDNWLGEEGSMSVCEMLKENCFITHINLSENHLSVVFAQSLYDALETNATLTHINVSNNCIGDRGAEIFATIILTTKQLEYINLSNNGLGEYAGVVIGPAIAENSCIKSLDFSWNSIRRRGAVCIADGIKNNVYLKKINLSWNGFGNEGACALGDALQTNAALEELDISNNRITTEGAVWIAKGLTSNDNLMVLKMRRNPMESAGCYAICSALVRHSSSVMKFLDFTDVEANDDCLKVMRDLRSIYSDITIHHGNHQQSERVRRTWVHPMYKLRHYMDRNNLRIIDFFNKFDKDCSLSVSKMEFTKGILETGIKLTEEEIEAMIEILDKDGDGTVNYSELVYGNTEYIGKEKTQDPLPTITIKQ